MKFSKIPPRAEHLIEFFEAGLSSLGAICERTWHDRLEILAEGEAARLWHQAYFSGELVFRDGSLPDPGKPDAEVFPGCPLTFQLAEALWRHHPACSRACLSTGIKVNAPMT